jgi:hypothetical protein
VVTVIVVVEVLEFGVTVAGLNPQVARAGSPTQEKLIEVVNEPCGITDRVNVCEFPAVTLALLGLEDRVKSAAFTVWVNTAEVLPVWFVSPA